MQALKSLESEESGPEVEPSRQARPAPKLVPALAAVCLGRLVAKEGESWRVRLGGEERLLGVDVSVDPALLAEALASGARVVVDASEEPLIVGLLSTQRAIQVARDGSVDVRVRSFTVTAQEKALLRVPGAFLQVAEAEIELYANRVLTRARDLAKVLSALIKLN